MNPDSVPECPSRLLRPPPSTIQKGFCVHSVCASSACARCARAHALIPAHPQAARAAFLFGRQRTHIESSLMQTCVSGGHELPPTTHARWEEFDIRGEFVCSDELEATERATTCQLVQSRWPPERDEHVPIRDLRHTRVENLHEKWMACRRLSSLLLNVLHAQTETRTSCSHNAGRIHFQMHTRWHKEAHRVSFKMYFGNSHLIWHCWNFE